jgi:putative NADH-flavin reductase
MRILVIGAAGRTGRLIVEQALGHGHDVVGFSRSSTSKPTNSRFTEVRGDAREFDDLSPAVEGVDAVAVAVGHAERGTHEAVIATLVHAMAVHGVGRVAVMSAAGAFARKDPALSLAYRARIATTAKGAYDDLEAMERRLMASALDWTIVRPVGLSDEPATGDYRVSMDGSIPVKTSRVTRGDVAGFMVKTLETDSYVRRAVVITA